MFQENASTNCLNIETTSTEDGAFPKKGHSARVLSPEEAEKLAKDQVLVSEFKQLKLEKEAQKNWDLFYKRNSTNFFKDRHWTTREFQELKACREFADQKLTILEAGCGVGNCLFPLLEEDLNIFAYACDFSPRAVEYVKKNALYCTERCKVFQCDLTKDDLLDNIPADSVDVVTLIFVLSAIHPDKMHLVLRNIYKGTANMPMEVLFCVDQLLNCGLFNLPCFLGRSSYLDYQNFVEHFLVFKLVVRTIILQEQQFLNLLNFIHICYLRGKDLCSVRELIIFMKQVSNSFGIIICAGLFLVSRMRSTGAEP